MIDINNVDWDAFQLGKSGRAVKLLYKKEPLQVCTSTLYTPFGAKGIDKEWSSFTEYSVDCSINNASKDTSTAFREFIAKLDTVIDKLVRENAELFQAKGSKTATATENLTYCSILRENGSYPKLLKLQLNRDKNGNFESFVFDENKEKIQLKEDNVGTHLSKGKMFKCIMECSKLWMYNGKIGSIWNVVQLRFSAPSAAAASKSFESSANMYNTMMIED